MKQLQLMSDARPVNRSWPQTKRYLTPNEAVTYTGIGHSTFSIHRMNGTGPAYIKWGRMNIRYDLVELDRWMAANTVTPTPTVTEKRRPGRPRKAGYGYE